MWRIASATDSYRPDSEDRAVVERRDGWTVVAVADGVGGRAGGGLAADVVARAAVALADDPAEFVKYRRDWLEGLDFAVSRAEGAGETTAVVGLLTGVALLGVAVGDSVAWDVRPDSFHVLTTDSERKPWLGSGRVRTKTFDESTDDLGTLLFATDGLVKYAAASAICDVIRTAPLDDIPKRLIDLARMRNGVLQDDVAVVVARWETTAT